VLAAAATAVCLPSPDWVRNCAEKLSHLAFDALTDDPDGPVDRQAAALGAHWYERHLVPLAGTWIDDLDVAERARDVARRTGAGARAEADAQAGVVRVLLDTGVLLDRAAREAAELSRLLSLPEHHTESDLRSRCDVLSRRGLALLRFGDLENARESFESSLKIAENEREPFCGIGEASSYAARARNNLGEVLGEEGRPVEGAQHIEQARTARAEAATRTAGVSAAWRRYTLTAQASALAAIRSGRVVRGVRLAEAVVTDRRERLGELVDINVVAARVSLGEALVEAGHPVEARHLLQEAGRHRADLLQPIAYWPAHDTLRLAQAELALEDGGSALRVLERSAVLDEWFARHVSFRLWAEARVTQALAMSLGGDDAAACRSLDELNALLGDARPDALVLSAARALAEVRLRAGDPVGAAGPLERVRAAESRPGDPPGRARTLLLAARCADARGDALAASRHRTALAALVDDGIDATHPLLLEGRYDEARRRFDEGRFDGLDELLAPLLDRTPLEHKRPPLGDGHPLMFRAVLLADHSGAVRMPQAPRQVLWEDV
jgi:tetratricopeptide (TPR) repeat protein